MAKLKPQTWGDKTQGQRLAAMIYPGQASPQDRATVTRAMAQDGKRGSPKLLPDHSRGAASPLGGVASGWNKPKPIVRKGSGR